MTLESREAARAGCRDLRQLTRRMCIMASSDPPFSQALIEQQLASMQGALLQIMVATFKPQDQLLNWCASLSGRSRALRDMLVADPGMPTDAVNVVLWELQTMLDELKAAVREDSSSGSPKE